MTGQPLDSSLLGVPASHHPVGGHSTTRESRGHLEQATVLCSLLHELRLVLYPAQHLEEKHSACGSSGTGLAAPAWQQGEGDHSQGQGGSSQRARYSVSAAMSQWQKVRPATDLSLKRGDTKSAASQADLSFSYRIYI